MTDIIQAFRQAAATHGLDIPDEVIGDGVLHRFTVPGDKAKANTGWYTLHLDHPAAGSFGCWKRQVNQTWCSVRVDVMTEAERAVYKVKMNKIRIQREEEKAKVQAECRAWCADAWDKAKDATNDNPYLKLKGVNAYGLKSFRDSLLIPVRDLAGTIHGMQFLQPDSSKKFKTGTNKTGHFFKIGNSKDNTIIICEGYATGATLHQATGHAVVVAFDCGNLLPVAAAIRAKFPVEMKIIVAADDDQATEGNPGRTAATEAAQAVGGLLALPDFGPKRPAWATDMNDLHCLRGLPAVKACIEAAICSPSSKNAVTAVTDVQASNDGPSRVTADHNEAVTAVTVPEDERPCFKVLNDWATNQDGYKMRPGVWFFGIQQGKGENSQLTQQWICAPIHIEAVTFDGQENNFGRLLRMKNTLGRWRYWAMPMELLRGAGDELRGELLAMGVEIDPKAKNELARYLQAQHPKRNVTCALQVGWNGANYVLPDSVIGPGADAVIFQSGERGHDEHTTGGTLEGWRQGVAARAAGNPLLVLSLSAAFAGPMQAKTNSESGGLHYVGDSSTGKSTVIDAACSIWGGPNFKRS